MKRADAHPNTLRRAVAFVDENAHRDISVADIARAAFVTTRAIQLAFRRHPDMTPRQYLRRVRLAGVHTDLLAADPDTTTVIESAARWGFANYSRFGPPIVPATVSSPPPPCGNADRIGESAAGGALCRPSAGAWIATAGRLALLGCGA